MKIVKPDYDRLTRLINATLEKNPTAQARYKEKGLSDMRFRWDTYHHTMSMALREKVEDYLFLRSLSDYLNDEHIDTALRAIIHPA